MVKVGRRHQGSDSMMIYSTGGCFTNILRALENILSKLMYCRNHISCENFKLKSCACAQSIALGIRTKFQLEILTRNVISCIVYFREIILESSRNVSETTPWFFPNTYKQNTISKYTYPVMILAQLKLYYQFCQIPINMIMLNNHISLFPFFKLQLYYKDLISWYGYMVN